jgi:hypothetical protein
MDIMKPLGKLPLLITAFLALAASAQAQSFLTNGLVAYYPFSGNANDATGNGHDGMVMGATLTTDRFGQSNSAYAFNGTNSLIVVSNSAALQPTGDFTISVWSQIPALPGIPESVFCKHFINANNSGWAIDIEPPGTLLPFLFQAAPLFDGFSPQANIPTGTWFQAVFTYQLSSGACNIYVNGVLADSRIRNYNTNSDPNPLIIGAEPTSTTGYGYYFTGLLDDVRIYNRALASNEVYQLFTVEAAPPSITANPKSVIVNAYDTATFNVTATGSPPLSYQWYFNGSNVVSSVTNTLSVTNVEQSDLGAYTVIVTNIEGSVTSSPANIFMYPYIVTPFGGLDTYWGQTNTLSVGAWGTAISYQWFFNGVSVQDATNSTLTLDSIQFTNAGLYSVVITSFLGSITNTPEQVVVNPANVSLSLCPNVVIQGTVGYNYTIQSTTNLSDTNAWVTTTNLILTQPIQYWDDISTDVSKPGNPQKFYRVLPSQ